MGFGPFVLLLPQPGEAGRGAQFPPFGTLFARDGERGGERGLGFAFP